MRATLAWLAHPVTAVAVVVLLVNDHLLKAAWPGPVTGKLSDVAGMLVAPPLIALALSLTGMRGPTSAVAGLIMTGTLFTLMKTNGYAAQLAESVWSSLVGPSRVVVDPTDLLALPALAIAWWLARFAARRTAGRAAAPFDVDWSRRVRVLVVLPLAALALGSSSVFDEPAPDPTMSAWEGQFLIWDGTSGRLSADGLTWRDIAPDERASIDAADLADGVLVRMQCLGAGPPCYRVDEERSRVWEFDGATWRVAWEISEGRQEFLRRPAGFGPRKTYARRSLAVLPVAGGHVVVVADGLAGVIRRGPDGTWERISVAGGQPKPLRRPGRGIGAEVWIAVAAGFSAFAAACVPRRALRRRALMPGPQWGPGVAVFGALFAALNWMSEGGILLLPVGVLLVPVGAARIVWQMVDPPTEWSVAVGMAAFVVVALPFLGWSAGWPDDYRVAWAVALVAGTAVTVAGWWRARRRATGMSLPADSGNVAHAH
jgi:hypothetical protein